MNLMITQMVKQHLVFKLENNKILTDSFFVLSCDFSFEINKKLSNKFLKQ